MKRYIKSSIAFELSNQIEDAWLSALFKYDITSDDVHLLDFKSAKELEKIFARKLKESGIDLSGTRAELWPGFKVGGSPASIANQLIRENIREGWNRINFTVEDLLDHSGDLYEEDKYGYCNPCSKSRAKELLGTRTGYTSHGHGSQSYDTNTQLRVYKDDFGNVKFERYTEIWD